MYLILQALVEATACVTITHRVTHSRPDASIDACGCELVMMGIVHTIGAAVVAAIGFVFPIRTLQALELMGPGLVARSTLQVT